MDASYEFLCRQCAALIPSTVEICPKCGRANPFEEIAPGERDYCRKCYEFIPTTSLHCRKCGRGDPFADKRPPTPVKQVLLLGGVLVAGAVALYTTWRVLGPVLGFMMDR
ncbi:MAG: hypothetical protein ACRD96_23455 [Bryobacteraceae bacterium]